jgi:hypothetical protein
MGVEALRTARTALPVRMGVLRTDLLDELDAVVATVFKRTRCSHAAKA